MLDIQIIPLAEKPEWADVCAAWSFSEWGCQVAGAKLEGSIKSYRAKARNKDGLPLIWIAVCGNWPVGMVRLQECAHDDFPDARPAIENLYVHYTARGRGLGDLLMEVAEKEAKGRGHDQVWLVTSDASEYYKKRGWEQAGEVKEAMHMGRMVPLMRKEI